MKRTQKIKTVTLPSGRIIPALGLGTWYLGKDAGAYFKETDLLRLALEIGYRFFDTAGMYGGGGAEEVLGEAVADCRDEVFLTSKVSPEYATYESVIDACDKSLERLRTDCLDMYLLHWNASNDPFEILEAFTDLKKEGKIKDFGVSHFETNDLKDWLSYEEAGSTAMNQTHFSLVHRQAEKELLPFCRKKKIPLIAYAPSDTYPSAYENETLREIAESKEATPQQIALAWLLAKENVGVLVKAETEEELLSCYQAQWISLDKNETDALAAAFPAK